MNANKREWDGKFNRRGQEETERAETEGIVGREEAQKSQDGKTFLKLRDFILWHRKRAQPDANHLILARAEDVGAFVIAPGLARGYYF